MTDNNDFSNPVETGPVFRQEFEKLRHMETFSDEMFNRIVGFQEREHIAWDSTQSFADRIKDLALHALIFSNPDRDATVHAHTVAPFIPCSRKYSRLLTALNSWVMGNGFVISMLIMVLLAAC